MKILKNKIAAIIISLFFVLSMTTSMTLIPNTNAHSPPWNVPTAAYCVCAPGIVGVGQYTQIIVWLDRFSPTTGGENGQNFHGFMLNITAPDGKTTIIGPWTCSSALASDFKVFTPTEVGNYTIVFSWPGETIVSTSAIYSSVDVGDFFEGSTSEPATLVVQQTEIPTWPESPIPTDYWTLPINSMDRSWSNLASNWLKGAWILPGGLQTGIAPTSAHVLWAAPILASSPSSLGYAGGIADAQWPGMQNNINDYQDPWTTPIIMNGIIYYNAPNTQQSDKYGFYAVDLYTGQQLWYNNGTRNGLGQPYTLSNPGGNSYSYGQTFPTLTQGQLLFSYTVNGEGVASYLWEMFASGTSLGTEWFMLDPNTGNLIMTLTNVPAGTAATDAAGDLLLYSYDSTTGNLLCWNSTQAIYPGSPTGTGQQVWRPPVGAVINAVADTLWQNASTTWGTTLDPLILQALATPHSGYTMNVTLPKNLPAIRNILANDQREPQQIFGYTITATYTGTTTASADTIPIWLATINAGATGYTPWPTLTNTLNTNLGFTVSMDYQKTITVPLPGKNYTWTLPVVNYDAQIFTLHCQQTRQSWIYSLTTGDLLWGPTIQLPPMAYFYPSSWGSGFQGNVYPPSTSSLNTANGIFLDVGPDNYEGIINAYNITNGNLLWSYTATASPYGYESSYGNSMPLMLGAVCNGMIYAYSTEHSPTNPLFRNAYLYCINLTDGTLIWKIENFIANNYISATYGQSGPAIANGYLITSSNYDNLIYCIGKGPSATTVSTPQSGIQMGSSFTITGAVTDQSPGSLAASKNLGYGPNGIPCVSDASQEAWMEYIYQQQPKPSSANNTGSLQPAAVGVPVTLTAIDPNGNYENLGTATSNLNGFYSLTVDTNTLGAGAGTYQIIASFAATNSYGSSSAASSFVVNAPPLVTPTAAPISSESTQMYVLGIGIAIIIAIVIVGVLLFMAIRRRQ
jgi:outer membrane protein assembly factor BamB